MAVKLDINDKSWDIRKLVNDQLYISHLVLRRLLEVGKASTLLKKYDEYDSVKRVADSLYDLSCDKNDEEDELEGDK